MRVLACACVCICASVCVHMCLWYWMRLFAMHTCCLLLMCEQVRCVAWCALIACGCVVLHVCIEHLFTGRCGRRMHIVNVHLVCVCGATCW